jgi:hypothetical protein
LFLYSAADALIPPEGVEAFAAARARRLGTVSSATTEGAGAGGGRVVLRRWEHAAHCEIGKAHPEAYVNALRDFLRPEMSESQNAASALSSAANNIKPFVRPRFVAETPNAGDVPNAASE